MASQPSSSPRVASGPPASPSGRAGLLQPIEGTPNKNNSNLSAPPSPLRSTMGSASHAVHRSDSNLSQNMVSDSSQHSRCQCHSPATVLALGLIQQQLCMHSSRVVADLGAHELTLLGVYHVTCSLFSSKCSSNNSTSSNQTQTTSRSSSDCDPYFQQR